MNPEHFDPVVMTVLAVLAWGALFISLRREAVRARRAERIERAEMERARHNFLHRGF